MRGMLGLISCISVDCDYISPKGEMWWVTNALGLCHWILVANSGLQVFDFLSNSILKEVLSALQTGKPGAFSPGKPKEFLANYRSSLKFLNFLEGTAYFGSIINMNFM